MVLVRVLPLDATVDVDEGETLMEAASRAGFRWPTICGGEGECRTCFVEAVEGDISTPAPAPLEAAALDELGRRRRLDPMVLRLACQFRPARPVTVKKPGVRLA